MQILQKCDLRKKGAGILIKCVSHEINEVTEGSPAYLCDHVSRKIQFCCSGFSLRSERPHSGRWCTASKCWFFILCKVQNQLYNSQCESLPCPLKQNIWQNSLKNESCAKSLFIYDREAKGYSGVSDLYMVQAGA